MRTYTKEELQVILEKHLKYLKDEIGGERANLRDADLSGAGLPLDVYQDARRDKDDR